MSTKYGLRGQGTEGDDLKVLAWRLREENVWEGGKRQHLHCIDLKEGGKEVAFGLLSSWTKSYKILP